MQRLREEMYLKNKDAKDTIKHETNSGMQRRMNENISFQADRQEQYRRMLDEKRF